DVTWATLATWLSSHDFPDIHSRSIEGMTPLMVAALHGEDSIVVALLDEGAHVGAFDNEGRYAPLRRSPLSRMKSTPLRVNFSLR
ncbi:ankyrin repeat domain-containing protein, partial [Paraburkholderia diazotrophica]|uniref:ankyrin repeat domain-containing protein n=1 Tax=Paraburkholderia diazotrophica TaxID=667676 RepID=UPI0031824F17